MPLSEFKISKAKKREKPYKLSDGGGLFLLVNPSGSKLWRQKYTYLGKERLLTHGAYPAVPLAKARKKLDESLEVLREGTDPAAQKKLDKMEAELAARTTFKLIAEEYLESLEERQLAPATMRKKRWVLLDLAKPIHERPINEITSAEVLYLLKSIEKSGRRETAKKMRGALSAVFRLAVVTLRAENDPTFALRDALLPPKVVGRAAITDEKQFGALLRSFDDFTGWRVIVEAMTFQILTMTRPGEVRGAKKSEFDLDERVWAIPAERMKMRREHRVPLSRQASAIVETNWPKIEKVELLFLSLVSNRKWLSENALNSALRLVGYTKEQVTAHGFCLIASIILNSQGYDPEIIRAALAHQDMNVIRRTCDRTNAREQRAWLMQECADLAHGFRCAPRGRFLWGMCSSDSKNRQGPSNAPESWQFRTRHSERDPDRCDWGERAFLVPPSSPSGSQRARCL